MGDGIDQAPLCRLIERDRPQVGSYMDRSLAMEGRVLPPL
jgi:hypothetical protein